MVSMPWYMIAAVLTGFDGLGKLEIRNDVPALSVEKGGVLIEVWACGINNTDIKTRAGWYSPSVRVGST